MSERLPPPEMIADVLERAWHRLPEGHGYDLGEFTTTIFAYFEGMRPKPTASKRARRLFADIQAIFRVKAPGDRELQITSIVGAAAALQYPTHEAMAERIWTSFETALKDTPVGQASDWFCMFCGRTWEAGEEPESECPDCAALLMRATKLSKDEL